jgi:hypothetical protein
MAARLFVAGEIIAWLFLGLALFFVALWAFDRGNALRHEYLIGAGMAWVYGSPFWIGAPLLAAWKRRELSKVQKRRAMAIIGAAALVFLAL